jgi:hypothetical protein
MKDPDMDEHCLYLLVYRKRDVTCILQYSTETVMCPQKDK